MAAKIKNEVRVLGIDDASFDKHNDKTVKIIAILYRGGSFMDGVMTTTATVDGDDATKNIADMVLRSKFRKQLQYILIDGIAVGGFNVIDINALYEKTKLPVIVVTRNYPDFEEIFCVLEKLNMKHKIKMIENAGKPYRHGKIHYQVAGTDTKRATEIIDICSTHSYIPEPIRVAHLIGQGFSLGESRGRA